MIEVQCTSCHTRYRIDEQVLPEGLPTFKCSRCGHVFSHEPRKSRLNVPRQDASPKAGIAAEFTAEPSDSWDHQTEVQEAHPSAAQRVDHEPSSSFQDRKATDMAEIPDPFHPTATPSRSQS